MALFPFVVLITRLFKKCLNNSLNKKKNIGADLIRVIFLNFRAQIYYLCYKQISASQLSIKRYGK